MVHLRTGSAFALVLALVSAAAVTLQLESAVIMPLFYVTLHGCLLFCVAALSLFAGQAVLETARLVVVRAARAWMRRSAGILPTGPDVGGGTHPLD